MRQTKAELMAALAQLLEERPMNKIKVNDIVDLCGVNRNTFYYHFPDIPTLLQEMVEEKIGWIIHNHCKLGEPLDCILPMLEFFQAHRAAVLHIYRGISREEFLLYLRKLSQHMADEYFESVANELPISPEDRVLLSWYYQCSVTGVLLDWLDSGMKYNLEKNMERLCFLMRGNGERALLLAAQNRPEE